MKRRRLFVGLWLGCAGLGGLLGSAADAQTRVDRHALFEARFDANSRPANPYVAIDAEALLTRPDGSTATIPLFWDGGATWRLRVSPGQPGAWALVVRSSDPGLDGQRGTFTCVDSPRRGSIPARRPTSMSRAPTPSASNGRLPTSRTGCSC